MAEETILVRMIAETRRYTKPVQDAAAVTEDLGEKVDEAEKKTKHLERTFTKTASTIDRAKAGAQALGGRYGELAGRAEAAAKAAGPLGLAVGAAAVAMTAGAAITAQLVTETISLTRHLGDIVERADELALLGVGLDPSDVAQIESANDALDRLAGSFDGLLVTLAGSSGFVGAVADTVEAVNGSLLAFGKGTEKVTEYKDVIRLAAAAIPIFGLYTEGAISQLNTFGSIIDHVTDLTAELREEQSAAAEAARDAAEIRELEAARIEMEGKVAEARAKQDRQIAEEKRKQREEAIALAAKELEARRAFYEAEDALFFELQAKKEEALRQEFEAKRAFYEAEDALFFELQAKKEEAQRQALEDTLSRIDSEVAAEVAAQEQKAELIQQEADLRREIASMVAAELGDIGAELLDGQIERLEEQGKTSRIAQKQAFMLQKASDLGRAAIATALAVTQALAQVPAPGNIPYAATIGALGAVQIAKISAQQPPSFHLGSRAGDLAPDEVRARLTRGEAVITRQAQTALGLDGNGIADANAGLASERPIVMVYQHDRVSARYHRDAAKLAQLGAAPSRRVGRREKF